MVRLFTYLKQIINNQSAESSKRLIALFTSLMIGYAVIMFTDKSNLIGVLGILTAFVTALLGISTIETIRKHEKNT